MNKITCLVAGTMALLATSAANAQLAGVKILNISGIAESSLTSGDMTQARSVLTGAGATVTDVSASSFSAASLSGINILYVGLANNSFNSGQIDTINSFVNGGGGLVAVGTERAGFSSAAYEQIANSFGLFGIGGDRGVAPTATTPSSPIVTGPFGVATSYAPAATGAFNAGLLPTGTTVVWQGADSTPIIVTLNTVGRAFFFADTNFMEDPFIGNGSNRTIWGNAFAFTGFVDDVPEPASWMMMVMGFGLTGGLIRSQRRSTTVTFG